MNEKRRMTIEQESSDGRRSISLEQNLEGPSVGTPAWDRMVAGMKEQVAEKGGLFINSFMAGIKPAVVVGLIIIVVLIIIIMGGI